MELEIWARFIGSDTDLVLAEIENGKIVNAEICFSHFEDFDEYCGSGSRYPFEMTREEFEAELKSISFEKISCNQIGMV